MAKGLRSAIANLTLVRGKTNVSSACGGYSSMVESKLVELVVAGSSPVGHPTLLLSNSAWFSFEPENHFDTMWFMKSITGNRTAMKIGRVRRIRIAMVTAKNPIQELPLSDFRVQTYAQ